MTSVSYIDTGLTASTIYYYKISAYNADGQSSQSSYVSGTTMAGGSAPSTPTGLTVNTPTASSLSISWTSVSGATGYRLYRSATSGGTYSQIGGDMTSVSYTNIGLNTSTTYYYKVSAYNAIGESSLSSYISGTTSTVVMNYRPTRFDMYDASHSLTGYSNYSYVTGTNRISRMDTYNGSNVLQSYFINTYDGSNRISRMDIYNGSSVLQSYSINTYDGSGNLTKSTSYNSGGTEAGHADNTYSGSNMIESKVYTRSGAVDTLYMTTTYTYSGGVLTKTVAVMSMDLGSFVLTITITIDNMYSGGKLSGPSVWTYDTNGNLSTMVIQDGSHVTTSSFEYTWGTY
jgi:hypothetical protein